MCFRAALYLHKSGRSAARVRSEQHPTKTVPQKIRVRRAAGSRCGQLSETQRKALARSNRLFQSVQRSGAGSR